MKSRARIEVPHDTVQVRQMPGHAREVAAMVHGQMRRDLDSDRIFPPALTHLIGIIGEAAIRVSAAGRGR